MYLIEIVLILILLSCIVFPEIFTRTIIAILLLIFMIICNKFIKSYKSKGKYNRKVTSLMTIIGITYIALIYVLGIYIGFYNAVVKFSKWALVNYIIPYIIIIISIENIRKTILLKEEKKSSIIILIATVILDIALAVNIYNVKSLTDYYMLIGFVMFASIANNILYNYIIKKYRNCKAIIIYKIITTIYVYIIPIIPNINLLFESVLRMVLPYIIYLLLEKMYSKKEKNVPVVKKQKDIAITSILIVIAGGIVMLTSCQFKYGILVIGSGSMTGTINKGDAIIYKKLDDEVEKGDVIVFYNDNIRVIHRVIDIKNSGKEIKYYTQGDANQNQDEGYRVKEDIIGKVKIRIPYIGQFAVSLNEIFK